MPNLVEEGFNTWKRDPPAHNMDVVSRDNVEVVTKLAHLGLDDVDDI